MPETFSGVRVRLTRHALEQCGSRFFAEYKRESSGRSMTQWLISRAVEAASIYPGGVPESGIFTIMVRGIRFVFIADGGSVTVKTVLTRDMKYLNGGSDRRA